MEGIIVRNINPSVGGEYSCAAEVGEQPRVTQEDLKALDTQVGGGHYKDFKIQPIQFTMANNLDFIQGNIIKYACRHKNKNGAEDLRKVIHYAQLALQLQYGES